MSNDVFFNGRAWRRLVGEQEVKFLESLWTRSGGAQAPDQDLGTLVTTVTNIEQASGQFNAELQRLKRTIADQASNEARLIGVIKKLEHRISQLEDSQ